MKEDIRQRARELGFDDCRVTTARPPQSAGQFKTWLDQGQHGGMAYLERTAPKRVDPQLVLPGARSIITLAASYASLAPRSSSLPPSPSSLVPRPSPLTAGLVARYARFEDYHEVIGARLADLAEFISRSGGDGVRSVWHLDAGPVLERDLAQRAGLGFVGKHTNLISRQLGNWFFIGEIFTNIELEPDAPERNHCGSCTRCLAACPTGAIKAPFQLDARLCISYLTIELKGPIPIELRPAIGNRIFGCDDCLAVCPWNRFAREGQLMRPYARPELATPDLLELLALDEPEFKRRFAGTPILRAKRRGLLRNVCVALGNSGEARALPALQKAAADPEPLLAEHAQWALHRIEESLRTE